MECSGLGLHHHCLGSPRHGSVRQSKIGQTTCCRTFGPLFPSFSPKHQQHLGSCLHTKHTVIYCIQCYCCTGALHREDRRGTLSTQNVPYTDVFSQDFYTEWLLHTDDHRCKAPFQTTHIFTYRHFHTPALLHFYTLTLVDT